MASPYSNTQDIVQRCRTRSTDVANFRPKLGKMSCARVAQNGDYCVAWAHLTCYFCCSDTWNNESLARASRIWWNEELTVHRAAAPNEDAFLLSEVASHTDGLFVWHSHGVID